MYYDIETPEMNLMELEFDADFRADYEDEGPEASFEEEYYMDTDVGWFDFTDEEIAMMYTDVA